MNSSSDSAGDMLVYVLVVPWFHSQAAVGPITKPPDSLYDLGLLFFPQSSSTVCAAKCSHISHFKPEQAVAREWTHL